MKLSTPSFIFPGTYLENVGYIATFPQISSVELLFFLYDEDTEKLFLSEKEAIEAYTGKLHFTVHLPDTLRPDHEKLLHYTHSFADHYIVHPPAEDRHQFVSLLNEWSSRYGDRFLLENLIDRDFEGVLHELDTNGICCDIGHILMRREDPADFLAQYGDFIKEVHLHGVVDGWDHQAFTAEERWFEQLLPFLGSFSGTVNLEVFTVDDVNIILRALQESGLT
jgi:sugar phosphate isomerase/epimerase